MPTSGEGAHRVLQKDRLLLRYRDLTACVPEIEAYSGPFGKNG
jgi:hypothetical protein